MDDEDDNEGGFIGMISHESHSVSQEDGMEFGDMAKWQDSLVIHLHVGRIGLNGVVVGLTTYEDQEKAKQIALASLNIPTFEEILLQYSHPN